MPQQIQVERAGVIFHLTHATIKDSHYGKLPKNESELLAQISMFPADVIFCGHTHIPYIKKVDGKSIGQSRSGKPVASYAIWEDGNIDLKSYGYPIESTVEKINKLGFPEETSDELAKILITAKV